MWGVTDIRSERSALVTLPISYSNFYVPQCTLLSDASNPSGINVAVVYAFLYDLRTLKLQTDVLNDFDVDKPLKVSWFTIGK